MSKHTQGAFGPPTPKQRLKDRQRPAKKLLDTNVT